MRCAVTGVPIMIGTPVVRIWLGLGKYHRSDSEFDMFADRWGVVSTPEFGVYNDYGDLEDIESNPHEWVDQELLRGCEEYNISTHRDYSMFMLRTAWDAMLRYRSTYQSAYAIESRKKATVGYDNLVAESERRIANESRLQGVDRVGAMLATSWILKDHAAQAFGLERQEDMIWLSVFLRDRAMADWYRDHISKMRAMAHLMHWTVQPSTYAGQEVDLDAINLQSQVRADYIESVRRYYNEEDEDE